MTASIPNGFCSNKVLSAMVKTGFSSIYTSKPTVKIHHYESSVIIGRYAITSDMSVDYVLSILSSKKHRFLINLRFQCWGIDKQMLGSAHVKIRGRLLISNLSDIQRGGIYQSVYRVDSYAGLSEE